MTATRKKIVLEGGTEALKQPRIRSSISDKAKKNKMKGHTQKMMYEQTLAGMSPIKYRLHTSQSTA